MGNTSAVNQTPNSRPLKKKHHTSTRDKSHSLSQTGSKIDNCSASDHPQSDHSGQGGRMELNKPLPNERGLYSSPPAILASPHPFAPVYQPHNSFYNRVNGEMEASKLHSADISSARKPPNVLHVQNNVYIPRFSVNKFKEPLFNVYGNDPYLTSVSNQINSRKTSTSKKKCKLAQIDAKAPVYEEIDNKDSKTHRGSLFTPTLYPYHEDEFKIVKEQHEKKKAARRVKNLIRNGGIKDDSRSGKLSKAIRNGYEYTSTPAGFFFTFYYSCLVLGTIVMALIIAGAIKFNDMNQFGLAVEICGQVLNALGAIFGLGLLPSRLGNFKSILIMARYSLKIRSSRAAFLLKTNPSTNLRKIDKNDLLGVLSAYREFKIDRLEAGVDHDEIDIEDQVMILNDIEIFRVKKAIEALTRRLPWYKSQPSETHHAFPIFGALFIIVLSLMNSIANCVLCYFMWTYSASKRPTIALLICGAILVLTGISSAALIWFLGVKTKKKVEKIQGGLIPTIEEDVEEEENDDDKYEDVDVDVRRDIHQGGNYVPGEESQQFMNNFENEETQVEQREQHEPENDDGNCRSKSDRYM